MFAKNLTDCFSQCCVAGGDHWIQVSIFIAHDDESCKLPTYYSLEGFQHIVISQLFKVKLESCVFWLTNCFQAKVPQSLRPLWEKPLQSCTLLSVHQASSPQSPPFVGHSTKCFCTWDRMLCGINESNTEFDFQFSKGLFYHRNYNKAVIHSCPSLPEATLLFCQPPLNSCPDFLSLI